jgi:serine/threonine-protein kinase
LRFDKILLCGSILPTNFPWDKIIERGQVQSVRNEYGKSDFWTRIVGWFIPATGPSGLHGFSTVHARIMQEQFDFDHGEYFERGHMENRWIPFLSAKIERSSYQMMEVSAVAGDHPPWALVVTVLVIIIGFSVGLIWTIGRI